MGITEQKIKIKAIFTTEGVKKFSRAAKRINQNINDQAKEFSKANQEAKMNKNNLDMGRLAQSGFGQVMGMSLGNFKKFNQQGRKFTTVGGSMANKLRMMTHGARGFRMEMLGIMFFGMAIQRTFMGLLKTSMEWVGVWDILSVALGMLFLPIAEELLDWALIFLDWVGSLTEKQKEWIGWVVLSVAALGGLLFILGTLALGIGSIILVFGKLFATGGLLSGLGSTIAGAFAVITAPILLIIGIIIAIVIGMYIAWKENFLGMKAIVASVIDGIKNQVGGLINIFKGIFLVIKGIFLGDWSMIWEGVKKIFWGAIRYIIGFFQMLAGTIGAILVGILRLFWSWIKLVVDPFIWLYNKIVGHSIIPDLVNGIIDWFKKIPGKVWDALKGLPMRIINGYKNIGNKIANAFKGVGKAIAKKFKDMLPNWMIKLFKGTFKIAGKIGSLLGFAQGGIVPGPIGSPVPAIVHGGERIIPVGSNSQSQPSVNININANISSDYDVRRLSEELKRYWILDFERVSKGRTI